MIVAVVMAVIGVDRINQIQLFKNIVVNRRIMSITVALGIAEVGTEHDIGHGIRFPFQPDISIEVVIAIQRSTNRIGQFSSCGHKVFRLGDILHVRPTVTVIDASAHLQFLFLYGEIGTYLFGVMKTAVAAPSPTFGCITDATQYGKVVIVPEAVGHYAVVVATLCSVAGIRISKPSLFHTFLDGEI